MIWFRSAIFNVAFYVNLILFLVFGSIFYVTPRKWSLAALKAWARTSLWLLKVIVGTRVEIRGRQNIPTGAAIVAGKHQSAWETFALIPMLNDPAIVLKRELMFIPLFGWFIPKFRMIPVSREAGAGAIRKMVAAARRAIADNRQVLIFPEGTRRAPAAEPDYKPGAAALYGQLSVPCTPFALNSGLFWPRRSFIRYPGTIVVEFLPAIPPGLARKTFSSALQASIEEATNRLVQDADIVYK
jgi:1-acyl-sn-glycerol-3-phosphate acyltransferase